MSKLWSFYLKAFCKSGRKRLLRFDSQFMAAGIVISTAVLMTAFSLFSGYEEALRQAILGANSHLYIYRAGAVDFDAPAIARIDSFLTRQPEAECWAPAVTAQAVAVCGDRYRGVLVRGVDTHTSQQPTRFREFVRSGSSDLRESDTAVLGDRLAAELNVAVGDTVKLVSPLGATFTPFGFTPRERRFRVVGLYRSGMYEYDSHYFFVNPESAWGFTDKPGQSSLIEVRLKDPGAAWRTAIDWENRLSEVDTTRFRPEYDITTWVDQFGNLFTLIAMEKWMLFLVLSLLVLIAAFNTAGGVMTSILEQRRQIGILKAVGASDRSLAAIFLTRALALAAVSVIVGEILGALLGKLIEYQTIFRLKGDVYFIEQLHSHAAPSTWLLVFATALGIVAAACLFPLRRISKLQVTDILRGNS
jgi:lipoprotein-releasing system permease protein